LDKENNTRKENSMKIKLGSDGGGVNHRELLSTGFQNGERGLWCLLVYLR
jgi:hypothetical protein